MPFCFRWLSAGRVCFYSVFFEYSEQTMLLALDMTVAKLANFEAMKEQNDKTDCGIRLFSKVYQCI